MIGGGSQAFGGPHYNSPDQSAADRPAAKRSKTARELGIPAELLRMPLQRDAIPALFDALESVKSSIDVHPFIPNEFSVLCKAQFAQDVPLATALRLFTGILKIIETLVAAFTKMSLGDKCAELAVLYKLTSDTLTLYYRSSMEVQFPGMHSKDRDLVKSWLSMMISRPVDEPGSLPLSFKTCAFASMMRLFYFDKRFAQENMDEFIVLFCQSLLRTDLLGDCKCLMTMVKFFKQVCPGGAALQQLHHECSAFSPKSKVLHEIIAFIQQLQSKPQVGKLDSVDQCITHLITNADHQVDKGLREAALSFSSQSDVVFYFLLGEMSGIVLGRRLSFLAAKRLLRKISQYALPDDALKNAFLRFTLFTLFSYLGHDSGVALLEDALSGCDFASLLRLTAVVPFSSVPGGVADRLLGPHLGRVVEMVEFVVEEEPPRTNSAVTISLVNALANIVSECPDHPAVRACLSRVCTAACKGNGGSGGEGVRAAFACLTKSLLSVVDPSSIIQLLQSYCQRTDRTMGPLMIQEMSHVDLPSRHKEQFIKLLAEMLPKGRGQESACQIALVEHSIACFAATSPMCSLLEIPPFSLYNRPEVGRKIDFDMGFLSERLQNNPPLTSHDTGLTRKLSSLEKLIKERGQSMEWLEDELERLVDKAYACSIKNKG